MSAEPTAPDESLDEVWRRHSKPVSEADFRTRVDVLRDERASWTEREHAKARKRADKEAKSKAKE